MSSKLSYQQFEEIEKLAVQEELDRREQQRVQRRQRFEEEQRRRREEWAAKNPEHHQHRHVSSCSCGFADPNELLELQRKREQEPPEPEIPIQEKNRKKMLAIEATRIDGNDQFKKKNFELAFKIYERGVLIIHGCYKLTEEQELQVRDHEIALNLNMAACKLQLQEWREAIAYCNIVLGMDKDNPKALFRLGQAHSSLGLLKQAQDYFQKVKTLDPAQTASVDKQLHRVHLLEKKAEKERRQVAQRARSKMAGALSLNSSE